MVDQAKLQDTKDALAYIRNGSTRVQMRAANVGAARAKAESGRKLKALLTAPAKRITDSLSVGKRATLADPTAVFRGEGKPIKLVYFNHDGSLYRSVEGGILNEIFKAGGNPLRLKHGFLAKMPEPAGHIGIFTRRGPKQLVTRGRYKGQMKQPIVEHFGPNAAVALSETPGALKDVMEYALDKYTIEFDRQIRLLFQKEYGIDPPDDFF
jgi:hypothetical protein